MAIGRWNDTIHIEPEDFASFWQQRLTKKRNVLAVCGVGWDPRMTVLLKTLKEFGGTGSRQLCLIDYKPSSSHVGSQQKLIDMNLKKLDIIVKGWMEKQKIEIITRREDNSYAGDERIARKFRNFDISPYKDIVVDISALPKSLYFSLLLVLVEKCIRASNPVNLHVIVCQDVDLDGRITESIDDVRLLRGFEGRFKLFQSQQNMPKIWAPVLTGNSLSVITKLFEYLQPKDIYPVLPFPALNPRTDDDLLLEYHSILADTWQLNPMNIIYAAEDDPLDIYRSLVNLYRQQKETLEPLGGILIAFSCLAGKISSLGAFMAAFEIGKDAAVAHAIGHHKLNVDDVEKYWSQDYQNSFGRSLHSIWLTGEPYE
ncbi:MAG: hypothetical protein KAW12_18390 [Candidatus Aminicenantes bacterium]|nr:hypothetical protein [Candidatus Aminicenantes bacterium]